MNIETRMEEFSYAYIHALASQEGYTFAIEPKGMDYIGIDISIQDPKGILQLPSPRFSAQVKSTRRSKINPQKKSGKTYYGLKKKNYDTLIRSCPSNTILLFLLIIPDDPSQWIVPHGTKTDAVVANCELLWFCLQGDPPSAKPDKDSKENICLSRGTSLLPGGLSSIMQKIKNGLI
jgi:hypothetical protein